MSNLTGLADTLTEHPRILRARVMEHMHFDDDSFVGIVTTVEKRPDWRDDVRIRFEIDRVLLDDADFLTSYILKLTDDWVADGAPS